MKPFPPLFYLNMCNAAAAKTKGAVYMNHSLIEQAQSGDGEALITLIENNKQEMFRIAFGILKRPGRGRCHPGHGADLL